MTPRGSSGSGASEPPPLLLIIGITITGIMANVLITPAVPDIIEEFGRGESAAGLLLAAGTAPGILLAPVMGVLADRYGRRQIILPCLVLFGLSGGLGSFAPSFSVLLALRFLQGMANGGLLNLALVLIGDHWRGAERTRALGRNAAALTAAIVVLPPLGGFLAAAGGWRLTFAPYWVALLTAVVIARRLPRAHAGTASIRDQLATALPVLRSPAVLVPVVLSFGLFILIFGLFLVAVPLYLAADFDLGPGARGLVLAVPAITSTATSLNLGRFRARFGVPTVLGIGAACFAAGFGLIALVPALWAVVGGSLLYGAGDGLLIATLQDGVAEAAPDRSRGSVMAVQVGVSRLGQTIGPILAGTGVEQAGARAVFGIGAAIAATVAVAHRSLLRPLGTPRPGQGTPASPPNS